MVGTWCLQEAVCDVLQRRHERGGGRGSNFSSAIHTGGMNGPSRYIQHVADLKCAVERGRTKRTLRRGEVKIFSAEGRSKVASLDASDIE